MFYQWIIDGYAVNTRSFSSWIYEYIQSDFGQSSRKTACLCTDCMRNTSKGKIIRFKTVLQHQFLCAHHGSEMSTDQFVYCTFSNISFCIMFFIPDTESRTGYNRQMCRRLHLLISPVDCFMKFRRVLYSYKWIDTDTVSIPDQTDGFICTHDFIHFF